MSIPEKLAETRRRMMLDWLLADANRALNDVVLQLLLAEYTFREPLAVVRGDMAFLESAGLVRLEKLRHAGVEVWIAALTSDGAMVAEGRMQPGVAPRRV